MLRGYEQAQLAELVGVTQQTVSEWEREVSSPDIRHCRMLEVALALRSCELYSAVVATLGIVTVADLEKVMHDKALLAAVDRLDKEKVLGANDIAKLTRRLRAGQDHASQQSGRRPK